jgi:serine/threonine protein kinase
MLCAGGKVLGLDADNSNSNIGTGVDALLSHWQVAGENFVLDAKYKVLDYLGSGAYGVVCSAQDRDENTLVAIKKCKKIFTSRTLAKRTLREIRLLRNMSHENVIRVKTLLRPEDVAKFTDIYVVFEIMETDLAQIIRSPQPLKDQHVQYFTYQLLAALRYIHSVDIMHRDVK